MGGPSLPVEPALQTDPDLPLQRAKTVQAYTKS